MIARTAFEAPPRARIREGSAAQEVKEEPEDTLQPRPEEVEMVQTLRRYGVTTPDAVHSLRECGNRVEVALQLALDIAKTRAENKVMDNARLESEKEKDLAAERQSLEDKALKVLGEVTSHFPKVRGGFSPLLKPCVGLGGHKVSASSALLVSQITVFLGVTRTCRLAGFLPDPGGCSFFLGAYLCIRVESTLSPFGGGKWRVPNETTPPSDLSTAPFVLPQSLLLNAEDGCTIFRQFVERLSAGDGTCTQALCAFREKATTLLFLERDAFRHYPESDYQVRLAKARSVMFGQTRTEPPIPPDRIVFAGGKKWFVSPRAI